jgi:hypothetical protein
VLAGPALASASSLTLHDTGITGDVVRGNGARYIASAASTGPVTVLDIRTRARRTIPTPPTCSFGDIHRATLLWNCRTSAQLFDRGATYDLATGRVAALPRSQPIADSFPDAASYVAIGDRWAQATFTGYHFAYPAYVDRTSGQQRTITSRRDRLVDLDAPSLTRRLCSGQRRPNVFDASGLSTELGDLATAGRWAAATTYPVGGNGPERVELQRCGRTPRTLKICTAIDCTQPVINDRIVAWGENRFDRRGTVSVRLVVRSLRTGATRTTATGPAPLTPLLVGQRLYVLVGKRLLGVDL